MLKQTRVLLCLVCLVCASCAQLAKADDTARSQSQIRNIAFDVADVTALVQVDGVRAELEAYRSATNDRILDLQQCRLPERNSQLLWVSIGRPLLVRNRGNGNGNGNGNSSVFQLRRQGFNVLVQMLTPEQRHTLAVAASRKYNITVDSFQIAALPLTKFDCTISLYDLADRVIIKGSVGNFQPVDLQVDFHAPLGTKERRLFEQELQTEANIDLRCSLASAGKEVKFNTLVITATESQSLGMTEKLFGPSHSLDNTVFVTRQQMKALSAQMYSSLNILEEYDMPQFQFSEAFVDEMVRQTAAATFKLLPIDQALQNLSRFGVESLHDLQVNDVKSNLARLLSVTQTNNKSHIVVNNHFLDNLHSSQAAFLESANGQTSGYYFPPISTSTSIKFVRVSQVEWSKGSKTLAEQLRELNTAAQSEIEWAFDDQDRKIVPRSLSVAKLSRANFSRTLSFSRVRRQTYDAPFIRTFVLYSSAAEGDKSQFEFNKSFALVTQQLNSLQQQISTLQHSMVRLNASFTEQLSRLTTVGPQATENSQLLQSINQLRENSTAGIVGLQTQLTLATSRIGQLEQRARTDMNSTSLANSRVNGSYCLVKSHKHSCPPEFSNVHRWASNMLYCCNYV